MTPPVWIVWSPPDNLGGGGYIDCVFASETEARTYVKSQGPFSNLEIEDFVVEASVVEAS